MVAEPLDVVYTWVDDAFPGYLELRDQYAATRHDRNPNRTRDNLEMLRYSLRSLAHLDVPIGNVFLVSQRPQVPAWLNTGVAGLRVVHHDEFMDPALLPTPPCGKVLTVTEQATVHATVGEFNAQIAAAIAAVEQARGVGIASVDVFTRFDTFRTAGVDLDGTGTPDLTTRYLGGIFSLDGIHPTRTGNAIIANTFIDAINLRFGETIPHVDVASVAARDPLTRSPFRPAGEPPFGLIDDPGQEDLEQLFQRTFGRIERDIDDLRDKLDDLF